MEKRKKSKSLKLRVNPEVKETVKDVAKTVVKTAAVTLKFIINLVRTVENNYTFYLLLITLNQIIMGNYDEGNTYDPDEDIKMMFPDEDSLAEYEEDGYEYPRLVPFISKSKVRNRVYLSPKISREPRNTVSHLHNILDTTHFQKRTFIHSQPQIPTRKTTSRQSESRISKRDSTFIHPKSQIST